MGDAHSRELTCFGLMAGCSNDAGTDSQAPDDGDTQQSQPAGDEQSQAPAGEAGGTFTLGVIGPLTGSNAIYGTNVANAAQIAVDEINALGGDIQFKLISEDDTGDAETAANAYNYLDGPGHADPAGHCHHRPGPERGSSDLRGSGIHSDPLRLR